MTNIERSNIEPNERRNRYVQETLGRLAEDNSRHSKDRWLWSVSPGTGRQRQKVLLINVWPSGDPICE